VADIYHIWADKKTGISDKEFSNNIKRFLGQLVNEGKMLSFRVTRCKLGFRSIQDLPEWHIMMEFTGLAQLDEAFGRVAPRQGEMEKAHVSFNKFVEDNIQHALYRDWPDNLNTPKLTETPRQFTIKEVVEATKRIDPDIW
jgi:hypothetical protein